MSTPDRDQMNVPGANPVGTFVNRNGVEGPLPLRPYLGGQAIVTEMSAPAGQEFCVFLGKARRVEFVVRTPAGLTDYTIHYGRWLVGKTGNAVGRGLDGWIEDGTKDVVGAVASELAAVSFETHGDACGVWVDTWSGAPTAPPGDRVEFWYRALDG